MYARFCDEENIYNAYLKARNGRRYKDEILRFSYNIEKNLQNIVYELRNNKYKHGLYYEFVVNDSKKRIIRAAPFKDRIIHHALCNIIEPIFEKSFIFDSYACRLGKGLHKAIKRFKQFLRIIKLKNNLKDYNNIYVLKCDIVQYFNSVNKNILFELIKRKIKDENILAIILIILNSYEKGLPIGNLTSQLFANIYLDNLDKFIKHQLRAKYYLRYMDDFLILGHDKKLLHLSMIRIERFLAKYLQLELNHKRAGIFPTRLGVDFLGLINFYYYRLIRKSSVKRFCQKIKYFQRNKILPYYINKKCQSWLSYSRFSSSWYLRRSLENKLSINFNELF